MKDLLYPFVKHIARLSLAFILMMAYAIWKCLSMAGQHPSLEAMFSFFDSYGCRVLFLVLGAAACFTFALGTLEHVLRNRLLSKSKTT